MDYLEGGLPSEVQQPFEHHLSVCPACDRYLSQYKATVAAGRASFHEPDAPLPDEVPEELVSAILESLRHWRGGRLERGGLI